MGAYLAVPVTSKERFEGQGRVPAPNDADGITIVYGGAAMQGWRRTMEDAHLAEVAVGPGGPPHDAAVFGVFDGHGGAEVALFCQRYMAQELAKLEAFGSDAVEDALVDVFHRMDDMLRDHSFADEIEQLKTRDAAEDDETKGEDDGVSPMDALEMIKRVFQLKRFMGENGGPGEGGPGGGGGADEAVAMEDDDDDDEEDGEAEGSGSGGGGKQQQQRQKQQKQQQQQQQGEEEEEGEGGKQRNGDSNKDGASAAAAAADSGSSDASAASTAAAAAAGGASWSRAGGSGDGEPSGSGGAGGGDDDGAAPAAARFLEPADARIQAGCTAVVAVVKGGHLYVANAGDSRGVLCRGGAAVAMSEDHKPAQETERTRILNAGGFLSEIGGVCRVNGNLNLSRAIGDLKYKTNATLEAKDQIITAQPDVRRVALAPEDEFFLLACDGVWDVMTNQDAVDFVRARLQQGAAPADAASQLLDACLASDPKEARGVGCDNMTAIVVQLLRGQHAAAAAAAPKERQEQQQQAAAGGDGGGGAAEGGSGGGAAAADS